MTKQRKKITVRLKRTVKTNTPSFSREDYIQMQMEAYYQAIKRLENEKLTDTQLKPAVKKSKRDIFSIIICIMIFPWRLHKKNIADDLLSLLVSGTLTLTGLILYFAAIVCVFGVILCIHKSILCTILFFVGMFIFLLYGGAFIASSKEIENEKNKERLYAYSSALMSALAVIIALVAILCTAKII